MATKILKVLSLCIFLSKIDAYRKDFNETKYMSFLIRDDKLLEKYNEIWERVKNIIQKNLIVNEYMMKNI